MDCTQDHTNSYQDRFPWCHCTHRQWVNKFISERLANRLQLPVVPTKTFTVQIANGEKLKCYGCFEEVWMDPRGTHFSLTLYSLPLTGLDVVLGIQWLETLGFMVCNWKQVIMEFLWKNQIRRLQGANDESFKPQHSNNYQMRFARTMLFLQYAYRSVLRNHTKNAS